MGGIFGLGYPSRAVSPELRSPREPSRTTAAGRTRRSGVELQVRRQDSHAGRGYPQNAHLPLRLVDIGAATRQPQSSGRAAVLISNTSTSPEV